MNVLFRPSMGTPSGADTFQSSEPHNGTLISLRQVSKSFPLNRAPFLAQRRVIRAVRDVSLDIKENETLALVGESGSGKTTLARMILRLETPTSGTILFRHEPLHKLSRGKHNEYRSAVQAVFQDPFDSLNPRMKVRSLVEEPLIVGSHLSRAERRRRVDELLDLVGIPKSGLNRYPHEFSGGQTQRIAIARALALNPALIVLDEPVSKLDVSVGAQIMNLLRELQGTLGLAYFIIAHNLATVRFMSDRLAVMYLGSIVEQGDSDEIFRNPSHPYTRALFALAQPLRQVGGDEPEVIRGEISSAADIPEGCPFHPRCPQAMDVCSQTAPQVEEINKSHWTSCWLYSPHD